MNFSSRYLEVVARQYNVSKSTAGNSDEDKKEKIWVRVPVESSVSDDTVPRHVLTNESVKFLQGKKETC